MIKKLREWCGTDASSSQKEQKEIKSLHKKAYTNGLLISFLLTCIIAVSGCSCGGCGCGGCGGDGCKFCGFNQYGGCNFFNIFGSSCNCMDVFCHSCAHCTGENCDRCLTTDMYESNGELTRVYCGGCIGVKV